MTGPGAGDAPPDIVLDISRLLSRLRHATPTGVDRVEMAYARQLLTLAPGRLHFAAVHPSGFYGRLPRRAAIRFLDSREALWEGRTALPRNGPRRWLAMLSTLWALRPRPISDDGRRRVVVQSSPHHLHREQLVRTILHRERARFACFVHDLIPIEFPEYAREGGAALHARRIATIERHADLAIANSSATRAMFLDHAASARAERVIVAPLGVDRPAAPEQAAAPAGHPYFVCIGTIEPRKNHLLLLHIWRDLAQRLRAGTIPRLVIIGRRGWENEQVVDLLERCPALTGCVEELNGLPDQRLGQLLRGARALLLPSFAEGYGMPVAEALDAGVPVICSDLPALREAGGGVPDYLDPLDGPGWQATILDYAKTGSAARDRQLARLAAWRAPEWREHVETVLAAIDRMAATP